MKSRVGHAELVQCIECTCFSVRKASRAITQFYEGMLQPTGLRATQFGLLVVLAHTGPANITHLGRALVMDRTTLTRNLKPLAKKGFITIGLGEDQRTRSVALTTQGHQALAKALPLWVKAQAHVVNRLGQERWRRLMADLSATVALARAS
jgi:DNA-binding MarR family transcriptional regulator